MNYKDHITQLITDAKISDQTAADAMGIKIQTFRDNKSDKRNRHNFTEKNYNDLKAFLVEHAKTITFAVKSNVLPTYDKTESELINKAQEESINKSSTL